MKHHQYDEIEFTYTTHNGMSVFVQAFAKVIQEDHTGSLGLVNFAMNVWPSEQHASDDTDAYSAKDLPVGEWQRIEAAAEDRLYEDFRRRRESAREGDW